jgi:hypothetical protein
MFLSGIKGNQRLGDYQYFYQPDHKPFCGIKDLTSAVSDL